MILHKDFENPPNQGQLAQGGDWEKAVIFKPGQFRDEIEARGYVGQSQEIACEAFFNGAFFGIRRVASTDELVTFLLEFAEILSSSQNGQDFFIGVQSKCHVPVGINFQFAEVGAVNAWKSVGAFEIKDPTSALSKFEDFGQELMSAPVGENSSHAKAVEFAFDNGDGTTHWIACPISEDKPPFSLDKTKLWDALSSFCDYKKA